jgi:hypothetical protein
MNTTIESRIARVARVRGISFCEAARIMALRRAAKRRAQGDFARAKSEAGLTAVRSTWAWQRDFT